MKSFVCVWALFSACCTAGVVVHTFTHPGEQLVRTASASSSSSCVNLTDVADVAASAVLGGQLWLSAPQATAAALAMLLPASPRRRALAFVAHAANATSHFLFASVAGLLFVLAPGDYYHLVVGTVILMFVCGVLDVLGFLALLSGEEEAE